MLTNTDTKNYVPVSIAVQYRIALAYFTTSSTVASIDLAKVELSGSEFIDAIENQLLIFWQRMDWINKNNKAAEEEKYQMKKSFSQAGDIKRSKLFHLFPLDQ